ncbi:deoxyuridine 5'-triphosphate nucleotidohydrolase [Goodfellowiella coeruleoviolacea]|uniref:Deoxyuridine 5'-triphosphate nucleotidohydrolase n=1 Tax=Goodfellowiella coeruleoviolacea TaxID=334858 RepID=A0AAE3GHJ8_9PSEU|nr:deoxyuridine 5'-triphosphate nucleotidohydrolase [Goodfellowiella coeruleoviolacea]
MPTVEVLLTRLDPGVPLPSYARPGDAGADLVTTTNVVIEPGERVVVGTGIAVALPEGYAGFVHPRSGLAARVGLSVVNTPGTIDAGYRGEIRICLINHDRREPVVLTRGDRIAQLVIQRVEHAVFREVDSLTDLPESERGSGGYGSTGGHPVFHGSLEGPVRVPSPSAEISADVTNTEVANVEPVNTEAGGGAADGAGSQSRQGTEG